MLKDRAKLQLTLQVLWESSRSLGQGTGQPWHLSLLGGDTKEHQHSLLPDLPWA